MTSAIEQGLVASLLAGLATGLGGLLVLLGRRLSTRALDGLLAASAGVMITVSGPGLLLPGVDEQNNYALLAAAAGGLGVLALRLPGRLGAPDPAGGKRLDRGARVALGVLLHNLFEGLAVVASYGSDGPTIGLSVAVAIAAHNIPEGLAVAEPLRRAGLSAPLCIGLATLSGLGEPLGALLAVTFLGAVMTPTIGSAIAAGAMLTISTTELLPEALSHGHVAESALGLLSGALLTFALLGAALH